MLRRPSRICRFLSTVSTPHIPKSVPVVILGGGTVGQCLSLMLSRLGVDSLVVEQSGRSATASGDSSSEGSMAHPRAHVLHTRTMEIMRELGLEDTIHNGAPALSQWRHFRYLESMLGEELGSVDFFKGPTGRWLRASSPSRLSHLSQPRLDSIIDHAILNQTGKKHQFPGKVQRLYGFRGGSFERKNGGKVRVTISPFEKGGEEKEVECEFLVGAEGANSGVREELGIKLQGTSALQHFVSVHFTCRDLWPRLRDLRRPGMLHFVFNRNVIGVLVAHNLEKGVWVAQFPYYPPHQKAEDVTAHDFCESMIRATIGGEDEELISVTVHSADAWCMNGLVAEEFSDDGCRVFLCGDSAHQFPPSGGFGLNAGIHDAHNLAWKLASVLNGSIELDILKTYTPERKLASQVLRDLSIDNFRRGLMVPDALGMPPAAPGLVAEALESSAADILPDEAKKTLMETALGMGRALNPLISTPALTFFKDQFLARLRGVLERFEALPLLFPKHDLGIEYAAPGSLAVGQLPPRRPRVVEGVEQYQPRIAAGARLPHFWLTESPPAAPGEVDANWERERFAPVSSIDVASKLSCPPSRTSPPRWVMLVEGGPEGKSNDEIEGDECLIGVRVRRLSDPGKMPKSSMFSDSLSAMTWISGLWGQSSTDGESKLVRGELWDAEGSWRALVRAARGGEDFCVLVRPDGVVAWCGDGGVKVGVDVFKRFCVRQAVHDGGNKSLSDLIDSSS